MRAFAVEADTFRLCLAATRLDPVCAGAPHDPGFVECDETVMWGEHALRLSRARRRT